MGIVIETERLYLRTWEPDDAKAYWQMNQDPRVIEFLLGPMTVEQVDEFMEVQNQQQEKRGFTLWAAELKNTRELLGYIGLNYIDWSAHFTPAIEIGWRLGSQYWGNGYATEGAKAALAFGFNTIGLDEIVSFTVPMNDRSLRVMDKIGLQRDLSGDFHHPKIALDHPLSKHALYRLKQSEFHQN